MASTVPPDSGWLAATLNRVNLATRRASPSHGP